MHRSRHRSLNARPWLAIALAYALALQALFAAGLSAQHAAAAIGSSDPAVICFGNRAPSSNEDGEAPQRLYASCFLCQTAAGDAPAAPALGAAPQPFTQALIPRPADATPVARPAAGPRLSQGPPTAA